MVIAAANTLPPKRHREIHVHAPELLCCPPGRRLRVSLQRCLCLPAAMTLAQGFAQVRHPRRNQTQVSQVIEIQVSATLVPLPQQLTPFPFLSPERVNHAVNLSVQPVSDILLLLKQLRLRIPDRFPPSPNQ
eukprot:1793890-Rhodomonas_salina.1